MHVGALYQLVHRERRGRRRLAVALFSLAAGAALSAGYVAASYRSELSLVAARLVTVEDQQTTLTGELGAARSAVDQVSRATETRAQDLAREILRLRTARDPQTMPDLAAKVIPKVALVVCGRNEDGLQSGSATLVTREGLMLTNWHVLDVGLELAVGDSIPCFIVFDPAERELVFGATLAGTDVERDLAVVQLITDSGDPIEPGAVASLEDIGVEECPADELVAARRLLIVGYPFYDEGFEDTTAIHIKVTSGSISSVLPGGDVVTDAKIEHGNSGGAAFLDSGCFIGVPTAVLTGSVETLGVIRRLSADE